MFHDASKLLDGLDSMDLKASSASFSVVALLLPADTRAWEQKNSNEKQKIVIASAMKRLQGHTSLRRSGVGCIFVYNASNLS